MSGPQRAGGSASPPELLRFQSFSEHDKTISSLIYNTHNHYKDDEYMNKLCRYLNSLADKSA